MIPRLQRCRRGTSLAGYGLIMKCKEFMRHPVRWISGEDTALTAARLMHDENIGFLVVSDASGRLVGTLTDRDLAIRLVANDQSAGTLISLVMSHETVTCSPDDDVIDAERVMAREKKSRIVCVDEGRHILGVISISDLAARAGDDDRAVAETMKEISKREVRSH